MILRLEKSLEVDNTESSVKLPQLVKEKTAEGKKEIHLLQLWKGTNMTWILLYVRRLAVHLTDLFNHL